MGNQCTTEQPVEKDVTFEVFRQQFRELKSKAQSIRFGEVQKLRSPNPLIPNLYTFILPIKETDQLIKVQCAVISNYSDQLTLNIPILNGMQTVRLDIRNAPIIDLHDPDNQQIIQKFSIQTEGTSQQKYSVKVYSFENYHDVRFKSALYEAYLYNILNSYNRNKLMLREVFIIDKGSPKSIVFIFGSYLATLEDIIIYRKNANIFYQKQELHYIIDQLLNKYKALYLNKILLRDVRPSKIWLAESSTGTNPYVGSSAFQGYQFQNLEAGRKISERQEIIMKTKNASELMMTVRGTKQYSSNEVNKYQSAGEEIGAYDPFINDRIGLARTIAAIATLQLKPQRQQEKYTKLKEEHGEVYELIKKLEEKQISFLQISRSFLANNKRTGVLDSDYKICLSYLPHLLKRAFPDLIEESRTQILFRLHMRQQITSLLQKKMKKNYEQNNLDQNIAILQRCGQYYQGIGYKSNQYYLQQIKILLDLTQDLRKRGFKVESQINHINAIFVDKFGGKTKNDMLDTIVRIENGFYLLHKNSLHQAQKVVNDLLIEGSSSPSLPILQQIQILQLKGKLENQLEREDSAQIYYEKGLQMCKNRVNFVTEVEMLDIRSQFEYLSGDNMLQMLKKHKISGEISKSCGKCESLLLSALRTKKQIPLSSSLQIAKVYQSLGDLSFLRQDYIGTLQNYQKSYNIMKCSEKQISAEPKIQILQKIYNHCIAHSENFETQQRVKLQLDRYRKQQKNLSRNKSLRNKLFSQRNKIHNIIEQQENDNEENDDH